MATRWQCPLGFTILGEVHFCGLWEYEFEELFPFSQETWYKLAGPLGTPECRDTGASWGQCFWDVFLSFSSLYHHALLESKFPAEALCPVLRGPKGAGEALCLLAARLAVQRASVFTQQSTGFCRGGSREQTCASPSPWPSPPFQPFPALAPPVSPGCLAFVRAAPHPCM